MFMLACMHCSPDFVGAWLWAPMGSIGASLRQDCTRVPCVYAGVYALFLRSSWRACVTQLKRGKVFMLALMLCSPDFVGAWLWAPMGSIGASLRQDCTLGA